LSDWTTTFDLFGFAIAAALLASIVCPLIGTFLFVRQTSFHGIVLPQFAAAGIACGFVALPLWGQLLGLGPDELEHLVHDSHADLNHHLFWAALFTFGGLAALLWFGRRGGSEIGRIAGSFAVASAATELFAHASPAGEIFVHGLLRGEILFVGVHEFETLAVVLGLVLVLFVWFHRDLLITSFDRETTRVLGKRVVAFESLLFLLTGLTVSVCVMTVGPVVLFGLLVLPPLAARPFARSMIGFYVLASAFGLVAAVIGLWASFALDEPLGPCLVIAAALTALPAFVLRPLRLGRRS